jgi:hypothetical protein
LGWCISSCGYLTLPNHFLFFTQIINQSINYVFSIIHNCLQTFGQVFAPTFEEIRRFGREEVVKPILELSVVAEGNSAQIVGEIAEEVVIRWGKVRRVGRMWKNLPVEFLNGRFRHVCSVCVVGRYAEESLHVVDPGVSAGLLPPDGEIVDNRVQQ